MSELLIRGAPDGEQIVEVTPATAGWGHVGFEVLRLGAPSRRGAEPGRERCVVIVSGSCEVEVAGEGTFALHRDSPFEGLPEALFAGPGLDLLITPLDEAEVAICSAPARGPGAVRRVGSGEAEVRGSGPFERRIRSILMGGEEDPAESLLVCEVITPAGHWSSFPPHKHDRDELPRESLLEETYYHRITPAGGFGLQRVYTAEGDIDEAVSFGDRDTVLVPRGYHTVSAPPGYELYYLNVMAGPVREWAIAEDPAHAWIGAAG